MLRILIFFVSTLAWYILQLASISDHGRSTDDNTSMESWVYISDEANKERKGPTTLADDKHK